MKRPSLKRPSFRHQSLLRIGDRPIVSISIGRDPETGEPPAPARGLIAIGDSANGILAVGGRAKGIVAIGGRAIGILAFGGVARGLLAVGGAAMGGLAVGGAAVGLAAIGGAAAGAVAIGGAAAGYFAVGGAGCGRHKYLAATPRSWKGQPVPKQPKVEPLRRAKLEVRSEG